MTTPGAISAAPHAGRHQLAARLADRLEAQLRSAAETAARSGPAFRPPDTKARNAHLTNRPSEMLAALRGGYHWLEGDVRAGSNSGPVMAHDPGDPGLSLDQWLTLGKRSGRGLKLDFKEGAAVAPAIRLARAKGIEGRRLIFNIPIDQSTPSHVRRIRSAYPDATINLSPRGSDAAAIRAALSAADDVRRAERELGLPPGPVAFPMDAAELTRTEVRQLRTRGDVAVWNNPDVWTASDPVRARRQFIEWGVNGLIDLRSRAHA